MRSRLFVVLPLLAVATACGTDADPVNRCVPTLFEPDEGAILDNGCSDFSDPVVWEFAWTPCDGTRAYHLRVVQADSPVPAIDRPGLQTPQFVYQEPSYVRNDLRRDWTARVRSRTSAGWGPWSAPRGFEVESPNSDCP